METLKQNSSKRHAGSKLDKGKIAAYENGKPRYYTGARRLLPHAASNLSQPYAADRLTHAWLGKWAPSLSHISTWLAFLDWAAHLGIHPYSGVNLHGDAWQRMATFSAYIRQSSFDQKVTPPMVVPKPHDHRFDGDLWQTWPYNWYHQGFLLMEDWWDVATKNIHGVSRHHLDIVNFTMRQIVDALSPSIVPFMNPYVIKKTLETGGRNFLDGANHFVDDYLRWLQGNPPEGTENFVPGQQVAVTPGKVVFRNDLIELIQYQPQTDKVFPEPVLVIPAWIMKYYILDLSPHNSLVRYLVENGHTVFMVSWKNPAAEDRDLSFEDYLNLGVFDALEVVQQMVPQQKVHAAGYCLGGTLLMIAAAFLAKKDLNGFATLTNLAAQIDFEEAGELMLFIDESQLDYIEDSMWEKGYLDGYQMAGAFYLLRSNDLVWSRIVHEYLMGERQPLNDLMAWNADATRMPFKMHSEYLRQLFLNNELSEGRYQVNSETIALTDIRAPIFSVSTQADHVAPWQSVYKIHLYSDTEVTFVLTSGGHNAGIISEIGHHGRKYQIQTSQNSDTYIPPLTWADSVPYKEGSWWPEWQKWLANHSGEKVSPPEMGAGQKNYKILGDAPGTYIMKR